jgi:DNA-binding transcriptional regulator LsrR (DeoR family)
MHSLPRQTAAQVVQILGGVGNPAVEQHAAQLTRRLAVLTHGDAVFLPAPGIVGSAETARAFLEDQFVRSAMAHFERVTLALVGIGTVEPSRLLASSGNVFSKEETTLLHELGAVGDICLRFFDRAGKAVPTPLNDRVIGMQLGQLRKVKRCVGIAGGARKTDAIRGALAGKWINVLVTDRFTAKRLTRHQKPLASPLGPAADDGRRDS